MSVHNDVWGLGGLNPVFCIARDNKTRSQLLGAAFHRRSNDVGAE
jgi:hypothetical protein